MPLQLVSYLSPTGGWNVFSSLDNMAEGDAVILDNFFPETSYCRLRRGYTEFCATGETDPVQTLFEYNGGAASKLLAAAGGAIYDVTSGTASSLTTGKGSDIWSYTNYASAAGKFILAANDSGADKPIVYDGSTIANVVVTGVTDTELSQVHLYAERVFYVKRNTLEVWYTTAGAYQGALTKFDFGPICKRGGSIANVSTWTRDNGFGGSDDLFVVVTTKGEVLLYNGTNPGDPAAWSMLGRFVVGEPVAGPRCVVSTGPDMLLICEDGFQPLTQYLQLGETRAAVTNLAVKIGNAASDAVRAYKTNAGWQGFLYPAGTALMINIPVDPTAGTFYQYTVNTTTGAWCRYLGLNAYCWAKMATRPYFGGADGKVYLWDTGASDNGANITGEICTAFKYAGARGVQKRFTMARPVLQTNGNLAYSMGVGIDFDVSGVLQTINSNYPAGGLWGTGLWGSTLWGLGNTSLFKRWVGVSGLGFAAAVRLKISTGSVSVNVNSFDLMFEQGGVL